MKARPIIFSAPMIRALLSGRKTQTRRVLKPQPPSWIESDLPGLRALEEKPCPYGQPGDLLWCKETWREIRSPARQSYCEIDYRADGEEQRLGDMDGSSPKWRSPRFMPRRASRLTLALTDVRVEKVQQISVEDARAEGCRAQGGVIGQTMESCFYASAEGQFSRLWESIHGPGAWERNDWVFALRFRVIHANVDAVLAKPAEYGVAA